MTQNRQNPRKIRTEEACRDLGDSQMGDKRKKCKNERDERRDRSGMPLPFTSRFAVDMTARVSLKKDIRTENMAAVMIPGCQCLPSPCTEAEALMGRCGNIRIQHQYHQQWGIHVLVCFPARVIIPSEAARFFEEEEAFVPASHLWGGLCALRASGLCAGLRASL